MNFLKTFLPTIMQAFGMELKNKDKNNVGADDRGGDLLLAGSQVMTVLLNSGPNGNAYYKAVQALHDAAGLILQERPPV